MILEYAQKVLEDGELTQDEAIELINVSDADTMLLLAMADKIRQKFNTNEVDCCAIINARSGHCSEDCKFCAQSAYNKTGVEVYGLLPEEEIVAAAQKAKAAGAVRFSIVTSGRGQQEQEDFRKICKTLTRIKEEVKIEVCASLGILTKEQALALKEAGVTRFHSNIETAPSHFPAICSTHTYQDKMSTLEAARAAGIRVCSGGILGLNETPEQRVEMAMELKRLGVDSVPLNILNPVKGSPFADNKPLTTWEILRAFAVFRFILPRALIRTAGGREVNLRDMQALALSGGLNGIMIGGYLTTGGRDPHADKIMLQDLGRTAAKPQV